jgi:rRNA-processing protein FCF1
MLLISDANIFIDLHNIGLLEEFNNLDIDVATSDFVYDELNSSQKAIVDTMDVEIYELNPIELVDFFNDYQALGKVKISHQDYSIYHFAKEHDGEVLTNDGALRKFVRQNSIGYKGIFYILDLIIEQSSMDNASLYIAIEQLKNNSWLPQNEIDKRLDELST